MRLRNLLAGWLIAVLAVTGLAVVVAASPPTDEAQRRAELREALGRIADAGWKGNGRITLAHDSTTILYNCTGYVVTHAHKHGADYDSRHNLCVGLHAVGADYEVLEGVERAKCFRDGALFGEGNEYGGCRWEATIELLFRRDTSIGWTKWSDVGWCNTCGGHFIGDSGRQYGSHHSLPDGYHVHIAGNERVVRFHHRDGTEYLTGESPTATGTYSI